MMRASEGEQYKYILSNIFFLQSDMYKSSKLGDYYFTLGLH